MHGSVGFKRLGEMNAEGAKIEESDAEKGKNGERAGLIFSLAKPCSRVFVCIAYLKLSAKSAFIFPFRSKARSAQAIIAPRRTAFAAIHRYLTGH